MHQASGWANHHPARSARTTGGRSLLLDPFKPFSFLLPRSFGRDHDSPPGIVDFIMKPCTVWADRCSSLMQPWACRRGNIGTGQTKARRRNPLTALMKTHDPARICSREMARMAKILHTHLPYLGGSPRTTPSIGSLSNPGQDEP